MIDWPPLQPRDKPFNFIRPIPRRTSSWRSLCSHGAKRFPTISHSPRLAIKLEVTTTHQRPVRLINETLQRWLQTHAQQGDAPYRIVVDPASFKLVQQIANPEELGAGESDDEGDRGRESPSFDEDRLITGGGGGTAVGSGGGGAIIPDREGRDSRRGRSSGSVEQLAPLEPPEEPRQATSRFELFWYVILGAEQGQDGGDA